MSNTGATIIALSMLTSANMIASVLYNIAGNGLAAMHMWTACICLVGMCGIVFIEVRR